MKWINVGGIVAALVLVLAAPPASAMSQAELDCCDAMDQQAQKYFQKHVKKVNKCTNTMDTSLNPPAETCDDGFDANTGGTDFIIDSFAPKYLNKMKNKCMTALGLTEAEFNAHGPIPSPCTCSSSLSLQEQMECKLDLMPDPADQAVCITSPSRKNANRGSLPPPGESAFCPL